MQPAVSASGALTYTPGPDANGVATVSVWIHDNGGTANGGVDTSTVQTFTITVVAVNDAPRGLTATPDTQTVQYSDPITSVVVTATDIDSAPSTLLASTSWKKSTDASFASTQPLGGLTLSPTGSSSADPREWTLSGRALVGQGSYTVRITVSDDGDGTSYTDVTINVTKEDATLEYTGDTLKTTGSTSATSSTTLALSAFVREAADGNIGSQLSATTVTFTLYKFTDSAMATPVKSCTATVVAGATSGTGTASCTVASVSADNYIVKIVLNTNPFYTAPVENSAVTVTISGTGFTTGGGWLQEPNLGSKSNFGFTVKYLKNGNVQGNNVYISRRSVGVNSVANPAGGFLPAGEYNWIIKSNAMTGLTQNCTPTTPKVCSASFAGKANITAVHRTTGVAYSLGGNYQFQVDVTDKGEPGASSTTTPDTYAIRVWDGSGTYYQLGSATAQVALNGGNIQVRP